MVQKGIWRSMQPMDATGEYASVFESPVSTAMYLRVLTSLGKIVALTKKQKVKTAFGTDLLFDLNLAAKEGKFLA